MRLPGGMYMLLPHDVMEGACMRLQGGMCMLYLCGDNVQ